MSNPSNPEQIELFSTSIFETRTAKSVNGEQFSSFVARKMAQAAKESGLTRNEIGGRMAAYLGISKITKAALDAYIAESKTDHNISLVRFAAFVHATGANWLWDEVVKPAGLSVLEGDEVRLAEIARLEQEQKQLKKQLQKLKLTPVRTADWRTQQ